MSIKMSGPLLFQIVMDLLFILMPCKPWAYIFVGFVFGDLYVFLWRCPLMVSLFAAGAVVLTCLGLVAFNWKLRQGKANEHTSENHCCRTFNESLCGHEARNHHAKGYCNCHLTQENEIQVTSIVGLGKEMPLLRENSHQAALASESTALDKSFRNPKGKDHGGDGAFLCLDSRLLQSGCSEPPGKRAAFPDAGLITRYCPKSIEKLRSLQHGEGQSQTLPGLLRRTTGEFVLYQEILLQLIPLEGGNLFNFFHKKYCGNH